MVNYQKVCESHTFLIAALTLLSIIVTTPTLIWQLSDATQPLTPKGSNLFHCIYVSQFSDCSSYCKVCLQSRVMRDHFKGCWALLTNLFLIVMVKGMFSRPFHYWHVGLK